MLTINRLSGGLKGALKTAPGAFTSNNPIRGVSGIIFRRHLLKCCCRITTPIVGPIKSAFDIAVILTLAMGCMICRPASATTLLLNQNFENPIGFMDTTGRDVSQQQVNDLYGNQPPGFLYAQQNTVETLEVNGGVAFGSGYSDPGGTAGNYLLGMLETVQNDKLALVFNVGTNNFLNVSIDITSIDLDGVGGPFGAQTGGAPTFLFSLYDNPGGGTTTFGSGATLLDSFMATGTASDREVIDFTTFVFGLSTSGAANGNVGLQIDLISGDYAGFDNLIITASNTPGDVGQVPLPAALPLYGTGLAIMGLIGSRRKRKSKKMA